MIEAVAYASDESSVTEDLRVTCERLGSREERIREVLDCPRLRQRKPSQEG